ncbi:MAG: glycosyltransferase family 2 protein [Chloroflexi bacterium]|nr:glycosyltransferase family 2 protein [Chloroflexota bacterium]
MSRLTAVILTYNEEANVADCLDSVAFADARVVFDSGSTDRTAEIAREAGATVIQRTFDNYANQRNAALDAVADSSDWVLFVDADERVTSALADAVRRAVDQGPAYAGWRIARHNYIFGKLTLGAGWYPDYQTRLLRPDAAHYDPERKVHEVVQLDGPLGTIDEPFVHINYTRFDQFVAKQQRYTAYEARILYEQGVRPKPHNFILQPLRHFRWRFFTLKGYRDGLHGLRLCVLMAWYELRKYQMLASLWRDHDRRSASNPQ